LTYLNIEEVHLWGGFPCTDLSAVKFNRKNLAGSQSSLYWEIPRVEKLVSEEFGPSVKIKKVLENVASMDRSAAEEITQDVGFLPYKLDCSQAVPMRRPRFAWTTERLEGLLPDVHVSAGP
jgi:site-specific DNA-cytosine methylase